MSAPEVILSPEVAAEDKGPAIIAVIVVVTILETLFTLARLYVRGRIMRHLQLDDYLIILAVVGPDFFFFPSTPCTPSCREHSTDANSQHRSAAGAPSFSESWP